MGDLCDLYRTLWNGAGANVAKYTTGLDAEAMARVDLVVQQKKPVKHLWVRRKQAGSPNTTPDPETATDLARETLIIAHERGHLESFDADAERYLGVQETQVRMRKALAEPTRREMKEVLCEERSAWKRARAILSELGWSDWPAFESARHAMLKTYRDRARASFQHR